MFRYLPNTALKASLNIGTNYLRILQSIQQILLLFNITKLQLFDRALAAAVIETSEEVNHQECLLSSASCTENAAVIENVSFLEITWHFQ